MVRLVLLGKEMKRHGVQRITDGATAVRLSKSLRRNQFDVAVDSMAVIGGALFHEQAVTAPSETRRLRSISFLDKRDRSDPVSHDCLTSRTVAIWMCDATVAAGADPWHLAPEALDHGQPDPS